MINLMSRHDFHPLLLTPMYMFRVDAQMSDVRARQRGWQREPIEAFKIRHAEIFYLSAPMQ